MITYLIAGLSIMSGNRGLMYPNLKTVQLVDTPGKRVIKKVKAPLIEKVKAPFRNKVSNIEKSTLSHDSIATESIKTKKDSSKSHF